DSSASTAPPIPPPTFHTRSSSRSRLRSATRARSALILVPATDTLLGPLWRGRVGPKAVRPRQPIAARTSKAVRAIRVAAIVGVAVLAVIGAPRLEMEKDTRAFKTKRAQDQTKIA